MKELLYRLTALRVTGRGAGCDYEMHILAEGKQKAVRGFCEKVADLDACVKAHIRQVYLELTGKTLPDNA